MELPIAKPPWKKLGRKLEGAVRKALYEFEMLPHEGKIAIALSGGKDSLTLLYLLKSILGRGFPDLELYAIHVKGTFSCGASLQENFLKAICAELGVPFICEGTEQKIENLNCYSCSRTRRGLLFEAAKRVGVDTIAFGHHRDDNAQTLLMNLFHKGEFAGMLPKIRMVDYGVTIIRPLIYIAERDITQFGKEHGFMRITCQCPVGKNSMRKKVDGVLSELEALFPHVRSNLCSASLEYGSDKANKP